MRSSIRASLLTIEHLICPICRQPFIEPAQTECGYTIPTSLRLTYRHIFCQSCISQALQSSSLCPIDRLPLSSDDIKPAPKIVASLVNELIVRCPRECGVDVERGCLKGHLKGTCGLETVPCPCGESITRRDRRRVMESEQIEDGKETEIGCIHEWQRCNDCTATFQRLNRNASPLLRILLIIGSPSDLSKTTITMSALFNSPPKLNSPIPQRNLSLLSNRLSPHSTRLSLHKPPPLFSSRTPRKMSLYPPLTSAKHPPYPSIDS